MRTIEELLGRAFVPVGQPDARFIVTGYDPDRRTVRAWATRNATSTLMPASLFFAALHSGAIEEAL